MEVSVKKEPYKYAECYIGQPVQAPTGEWVIVTTARERYDGRTVKDILVTGHVVSAEEAARVEAEEQAKREKKQEEVGRTLTRQFAGWHNLKP